MIKYLPNSKPLYLTWIFFIFVFLMPAKLICGIKCPFSRLEASHPSSPVEFVTSFYGWVFSKASDVEQENLEPLESCFENSFYKNLIIKMSIKGEGEILEDQFEYNPFFMAQDVPIGFKIHESRKMRNDVVLVPVELFWEGKSSFLNILLIQENDEWKIVNVISEVHNLKKEVDKTARHNQS